MRSDGLLEVPPDRVRAFLEPLPVRRIWGVGAVAEQRLLRCGFETVGDLVRADPERLRRALGPWGLEIARLGRGRELSEVEPYREPVSYSEENTFGGDVSSREVLDSTIIAHAESVARRLRNDGLLARTVVLKLKLARRVAEGPRGYPLLTRRATLPKPTDDGETISLAASAQLTRAALTEPIRLLGVGVTNLEPREREQLTLFEASHDRRRRELNRALDQIADRFGNDAVRRGHQQDAERAGLSMQIKRGEERAPERRRPSRGDRPR